MTSPSAPRSTALAVPDVVRGAVRRGADATGNVLTYVRHGRLADTRRLPRTPELEGPGWTLHRYAPLPGVAPAAGRPVLIIPPLGAPDFAFDLRRGTSLVEFLLAQGRAVHIVTYDRAVRGGGRRGLETWVEDIVPLVTRDVSDAHDGAPVHLVGWSLGGLFVLLADAAARSGDAGPLPTASLTAIASPTDVAAVPMVAPFRSVAEYTGGALFTAAYRTLGSFPAGAVRLAFQLTSFERYLTKPVTLLTHLDDRDLLAQIEAVDLLMANMTEYPGRAFGQLYHRMIRGNDLARGALELSGRDVRLDTVTTPVLLVAGADDVIAPRAAVEHTTSLLTASTDLRFAVEPGGHLGVLTGRRAREHTWPRLGAFLDAHDGALPDVDAG